MKKLIWIILILLPGLGLPVFSQEDTSAGETDFFNDEEEPLLLFEDEFPEDEEPDIESEEKKSGLSASLLENLSIKSESRYYFFLNKLQVPENEKPEPDTQRHIFEQRTLFSTYASGKIWQFNLALSSAIGNREYTYNSRYHELADRHWEDWLQDPDNERHFFDINELYLSLYFSKASLFLGRKIFVNTLSSIYTPADKYVAKDLNDPLDGSTLGRYQIQSDFYLKDHTLTALFFPVYQGDKGVSSLSPWGYYKAKEKQAVETIPAKEPAEEDEERGYEEISLSNFSYLLRYKGTAGGSDLLLSFFYGLAGDTVTKVSETPGKVERDVVPVFNVTAGFASVKDKFEFHGEGIYSYSIASRDDDYIRYVAGIRYTFDGFPDSFLMDKIELVGEYAGEYLLKRQSAPGYIESSEEFRGLKNDMLALILFQFTAKLKLNIFGQYEFPDHGASYSAHLEYQWLPDLALEAGGEFFYSPESSQFYYWRHCNRVLCKLTYDY